MLYEVPNIPPAIPLLLSEVFVKASSHGDALKRLRRLLPELQTQSRYFLENSDLSHHAASPLDLNVFADGGLNLLDARVGCMDIACRIEAARRFARSLGLLADTIWITDYLTEQFLDSDRLDEPALLKLLDDTIVINEIAPLIDARIIKFRSPWRAVCKLCLGKFENQIETLTHQLLETYSSEFTVEPMDKGVYALHTGNIYTPSMVLRVYPTRWLGATRTPTAEEAKRRVLLIAIRSALWTMGEASQSQGTLFSNSSAGLAALVQQENTIKSRSELRKFDEGRSVDIPWVSELSASQIVDLRHEASKALPGLRELLTRHLSISTDHKQDTQGLINELRWQAMETRNELEGVEKHASRLWKAAYATIGFGISLYGLATGELVPAAGGLLPILQLLIQHNAGTEKDLDKVQRRPGYVLVKAQDLLRHAH